MQTSYRTVLTIYENAVESLEHGLNHYEYYLENRTISDVKQAIMNLVNSIDLFILEKVKRIDENKVYENSKQDKFGIGYKKTISAEKAYGFIKSGIDEITDEELKAYSILKILRNAATHSDFSYGDEGEKNIVFLLHYIARFIESELDESIKVLLNDESFSFYYTQIQELDYGQILEERIHAAIESEIKYLNYRAVKDGGNNVVADWACHECGKYGVSISEELKEIGKCVFCSHVQEIGICKSCGILFDIEWEGANYDGMIFCDGCDLDIDDED